MKNCGYCHFKSKCSPHYTDINTCLFFTKIQLIRGPGWLNELDYLTTHTSLSPIWCGFVPGFVSYKKECTRLAAASDKVYQLLACGQWFSPGTLASSTTKTGRHDIAELLLKVALSKINKIKSNQLMNICNILIPFSGNNEIGDLLNIRFRDRSSNS